jgi:hypothetical protein
MPFLTQNIQKDFYRMVLVCNYFRLNLMLFQNFGLRILWENGWFKPMMSGFLNRYLYYRVGTAKKIYIKLKFLFQGLKFNKKNH